MKVIKYSFVRDWQMGRSVPGTGEVELSPAGRNADTAIYVIQENYYEPVARAQLEYDFKSYNISDIKVESIDEVKGILHCTRRMT